MRTGTPAAFTIDRKDVTRLIFLPQLYHPASPRTAGKKTRRLSQLPMVLATYTGLGATAEVHRLFETRKFLPTLFMPFKLSLLLIAAGWVWGRRRLVFVGLVLLYLGSIFAVSDSLRYWLESQYPRVQAAQCPTADAIVVLSGFAEEDKRQPDEIRWTDRTDRFLQGIRLYRLQKAPILLFTESQPPGMGARIRQAAVDQGVPRDAIRLTKPASNTAEEADGVQNYVRASGGHRVILVTSAIHMPRAARLFRSAGIDFAPFPVDFQADGWEWKWERFVPWPGALVQTEECLHEIYGWAALTVIPHHTALH